VLGPSHLCFYFQINILTEASPDHDGRCIYSQLNNLASWRLSLVAHLSSTHIYNYVTSNYSSLAVLSTITTMTLGMRCYLVYYAIVCLLLQTIIYTATNACYAPDGGYVTGDIPCGTSSDTFCCGADSFCLTNQICQYIPNGQYGRGSCTDMTCMET